MKAKELRELTDEQLLSKQAELELSLFDDRFTAKTGHLENPSALRKARKEIARIKTIITERAKAEKAS
ncbi:MAG: 50S ribosomal protein L29 [Fibrobacter sp.]|nr:50S ribosomal protein L29 [Fibrobacter sp.]